MFQSQSYKLDESQIIECQRTNEMLEYELEVLTAYQNKNKKQAQEQRDRERRELENRVAVRRSVLESKVESIKMNECEWCNVIELIENFADGGRIATV